jgi:sterol desaturase/sphingolipid hydroxylase (fatty acid hydroxylase superfamily)
MGLELIRPRRLPDKANRTRRVNNILLLIVDIIAVRLLMPIAIFQVAVFAADNNLGLFNILPTPLFLNVILTLIIFDCLIYLQHVITHKVNFLWQIHRVHHTDIAVDVTTGIRFHPFEIIFSMIYKIIAVLLLGPVAFAVILYEILLNGAALFTHSNILLNSKLDSALRVIFVTPDMHRIHHSMLRQETDSNFGNILSIWDKLFKTYRAVPAAGYDKMRLGLEEFCAPSSEQLIQLLKIPFLTADKL